MVEIIRISSEPKLSDFNQIPSNLKFDLSTSEYLTTKDFLIFNGKNCYLKSQNINLLPFITNLNLKDLTKLKHCINLYVLTTSFIIWFNDEEIGFKIPYVLISLHAIQQNISNDDNESSKLLYLQIMKKNEGEYESEESTLEISISFDLKTKINNFLLSENEDLIIQLFEAISNCSNLYFDDDDNDYENEDFGLQSFDGEEQRQKQVLDLSQLGDGWITSDNVNDIDVSNIPEFEVGYETRKEDEDEDEDEGEEQIKKFQRTN